MHEFSKFLFVLSLVRVCHDIHVTYTQCYQKYLAIQLSPTFHNRERKNSNIAHFLSIRLWNVLNVQEIQKYTKATHKKNLQTARRLHKLITMEHFLLCLSWFITRYETNGKSNTRSDRIKLGFLYVALWREDSHSWWLRREPKKREVWVQVTPPDRSLLGQKTLQKSESLVDALTKNGAFISLLLSPPDNAMILVTKKGQKSQNCVVGTKREKSFRL